MQRVRDLVERGRFDVGQLQIADVIGWILGRTRSEGSLHDLCSVLEVAARLALLKVRHLDGIWQSIAEAEEEPWLGPPPELPVRRSWLASRIAAGPLCFLGGPRTQEAELPSLAPIAPTRLRIAMLAVLNRQRRTPLAVAERRAPRVSTEMCSAMILEGVQERGEVRLQGIAGDSRDAHVAAFLSCLILARQGRVSLVQDDLFGDIIVRPAAESLEETA